MAGSYLDGEDVHISNIDEYVYLGGLHKRILGIWYRIESGATVDRDQYRHDLEERACKRASKPM